MVLCEHWLQRKKMIKGPISLALLLVVLSCKSKICDCEGFIDWESDRIIQIYSDSKGKTKIAELQNDLKIVLHNARSALKCTQLPTYYSILVLISNLISSNKFLPKFVKRMFSIFTACKSLKERKSTLAATTIWEHPQSPKVFRAKRNLCSGSIW